MSDYPDGQFINVVGQANVTAGRDVNNYYMPLSEWTGLKEETLLVYRAQVFEGYKQAKHHQRWNKPFFCLMGLALVLLAFAVYVFHRFVAMMGSGFSGFAKNGVTHWEFISLGVLMLLVYLTKDRHLKVRREAGQQAALAAKAIQDIDVELRRINLHAGNS